MLRFRKLTGGKHYQGDQVVKKGGILKVGNALEIPKHLRNEFEPLDSDEDTAEEVVEEEELVEPDYPLKAVRRGITRWWDVINTKTGDPINEKGMTQEAAEALVQSEQGEESEEDAEAEE